MSEPTVEVKSPETALGRLIAAWPAIVDECRAVLAGELHYQAVIYHCLRNAGVPRRQIGMNVKQWIVQPNSELFKGFAARKHERYQQGFEPIPDVVIFAPDINGDWRRRNFDQTLRHMYVAIEVKASERRDARLRSAEIVRDIQKLAAHRDEGRVLGVRLESAMIVVDTAPDVSERMLASGLETSIAAAKRAGVAFLYVSPNTEQTLFPSSVSLATK